jgi:thioredoxin-dependent peroxiredoxin
MLKPGDKAPEFHLKNDEGKDVALSSFLGKRVVLFLYPKANTPG